MATIPLLNGGESVGVAAARSPASGSVNLGRFSSGMTSQLSGAAQGFRRQGDSLQGPQMDPNQGQGMANGIRGLARGVGDFSNVMLQLANKKAEAKNYSDVTAARNQMLQIEGEFDQWRLQNPDPEGWESKWGEMSASARGRVTETKGLSPAAIERIGQEFEDFNVRQTINVGTMAVKGHVAKARSAVDANILRAVDAGDLDSVRREVQTAQSQGWMYEDDAVRTIMQAEDAIEKKQRESSELRIKTYLENGMINEARAENRNSLASPEEKDYQEAVINRRYAVGVEQNEITERYSNGEDPQSIIDDVMGRDDEGKFTAYSSLNATARMEALSPIYQHMNEERTALKTGANQRIEAGTISTAEELDEYFQGTQIDPTTRALLIKKIDGEIIKTEGAVVSLQADAAKYDPRTDPNGVEFSILRDRITMTMGDDIRTGAILSTLEKRNNGEPLTLGENIYKAKAEQTKSLMDAAADYNLPAGQLSKEERGGKTVFVDYSQVPAPDSPDRFAKETGAWFWKGEKVGKVINVSQDDRLKLEKALTKDRNSIDIGKANGVFVVDLDKFHAADSEAATVLDTLSQRAAAGEVTGDNWESEYTKATAPIRAKGAEKKLNGVLSPEVIEVPTGEGITQPSGLYPDETSDWIKNYQINF